MKAIITFWDWIRYNEQTLRNLRLEKSSIQKMTIFWLEKHLHNYCDGLDSILMFPVGDTDPTTMVISASGNPLYFEQVLALIDQAPKLNNWKFVAFIQPSTRLDEMKAGLDKPYVYKDIELKASEIKFMPLKYDDVKKIDIIVYLRNFAEHRNQNILNLVFVILQDLVGEKSLFENINVVELAQLKEFSNGESDYLYDLQFYIDQHKLQNLTI